MVTKVAVEVTKVEVEATEIAEQETGIVVLVMLITSLLVSRVSNAVLQRVMVIKEVEVTTTEEQETGIAQVATPTTLLPKQSASSAVTQNLRTCLRMEGLAVDSIIAEQVTGIAPVALITLLPALLVSSVPILSKASQITLLSLRFRILVLLASALWADFSVASNIPCIWII